MQIGNSAQDRESFASGGDNLYNCKSMPTIEEEQKYIISSWGIQYQVQFSVHHVQHRSIHRNISTSTLTYTRHYVPINGIQIVVIIIQHHLPTMAMVNNMVHAARPCVQILASQTLHRQTQASYPIHLHCYREHAVVLTTVQIPSPRLEHPTLRQYLSTPPRPRERYPICVTDRYIKYQHSSSDGVMLRKLYCSRMGMPKISV